LQAGWNVGEENRTKGVPGRKPTPDCGFPNPRAARKGGAALIVCYAKYNPYIIYSIHIPK